VGHAFRAAVSVILGSIPSPGLASDLFKPPLVTHLFGLCWPLDISQAALTRELFLRTSLRALHRATLLCQLCRSRESSLAAQCSQLIAALRSERPIAVKAVITIAGAGSAISGCTA
jgi:hypothetical protein